MVGLLISIKPHYYCHNTQDPSKQEDVETIKIPFVDLSDEFKTIN